MLLLQSGISTDFDLFPVSGNNVLSFEVPKGPADSISFVLEVALRQLETRTKNGMFRVLVAKPRPGSVAVLFF